MVAYRLYVYFERSNLSTGLHHAVFVLVIAERKLLSLFILSTMAQYNGKRYFPLRKTNSGTTTWTSLRGKRLPKNALVALFLAMVIILGTLIAVYNDYHSHTAGHGLLAGKGIPSTPKSPRITITSTVTVTSSPTPTGIQ